MNFEEFKNEVKDNILAHLPEKYEGADVSISEVALARSPAANHRGNKTE